MPRKLILFAAIVVGLQLVRIAVWGPAPAGGLVSDLLQIAASGAAAVACFGAARRARGPSRPFWLLFGAAMIAGFGADVVWSWFQDWRHIPAITEAVPRGAILLRTLFLTMLAFRGPDAERLDLGSLIDFVQLSIIYALTFVMVDPSAYSALGPPLAARGVWMAMLPRLVLLAVTLIQVARSRGTPVARLHRIFLLYLAWYLFGEGPVDYAFSILSLPTGTWLDLAWTVPPLAVAWWASGWKPEAAPEAVAHPKSVANLLLANAPFTLAPMVVLFQTVVLGSQYQVVRYSLLALSILCFAARLGLSEYRQARQLDSLQRLDRTIQAANEALRAQSAFLEQLIERAPGAIAILNGERFVERINGEFTRLFGFSPDEVRGRALSDFIVPEDRVAEVQDIRRKVDQGLRVALESVRRNKEGAAIEVSILSSAADLPNGRKVHIVVFHDIRDRKRVEMQLIQAQKMEAVGRLAGGVAHDFNNLLTVINGYGDMLLARSDLDDEIREQIELICKAGGQATQLTGQLLAFGRKQVVRPSSLNLNTLIAGSRKMFSRLIGEDVELTTVLRPGLGDVLADHGQLHQVLMNLLVNARDAMPRGGKIVIETANVTLDEASGPENGGLRPGSYVLLTVADSGLGMNAETREHVFEPFFTAKKHGQGTGLGLSIVYGIVRQSGGWIGVDSEPGKGSKFNLLFPRGAAGALGEGSAAAASPPADGAETLLLVEDQDDVREFAARVLKARGYRVLVASDGDAALAVAQEFHEPIHLLVTDVVMRGMSGYQIAERLRESRPGMKVLYASGYPEAVIEHHRGLDRDVEVMRKPFAPEELAAKVRQVLQSEPRP